MMTLASTIFQPQYRAGGPRYARAFNIDSGFGGSGLEEESFHYEPLRDREFNGGGGGRGFINLDPIGALPKKIVSPTEAALSLAGGLTLAQLDQAARFEVAEGVPIGVYYGRNLFALKLVSRLFDPVTPQLTATGILGEGWGGLGQHGEWERIVNCWYKGEALVKRFDYTIWFNDRLPAGATLQPDTDGWNWVSVSPAPYIGRYAHQSPNKAGQHQHYFQNATQGLAIAAGDILSCWIWIDPVNTPTEIMLQFAINSDFEHRAYWGANSILLGTNGTNSRRQISASIPATGQWVSLDVPASQVGLEGQTINGIAFTLFGGAATWSEIGRWKSTMPGNSGYIFRPGRIGTKAGDFVQVQDITTWPSGLAYSGSANVTVRLTNGQIASSVEDRADAIKVLADCRRTPDYDATGAEIDYGYEPSPARAAADRILFFHQRRFRDNSDLAQTAFRESVDWPSWVRFRDNARTKIPWDREGDGVNVFVTRFEFNGGFTGKLTLAQALDEICGNCATGWQNDGGKIKFVPPEWPPVPVHHFHPGNIVEGGEPMRSTESLDARPNRVIVHFRDTDGDFLEPASVEPRDDTPQFLLRQDSQDRVGEIRSEYAAGGMTYSQASRIAEYIERLEHDNPVKVRLIGNATSLHVLPWDFATVSHPVLGWDHQLCLVRGVTLRSGEDSADECVFILQRIDGPLHEDNAQRPRQPVLTL